MSTMRGRTGNARRARMGRSGSSRTANSRRASAVRSGRR
jgi:hypothetical protein